MVLKKKTTYIVFTIVLLFLGIFCAERNDDKKEELIVELQNGGVSAIILPHAGGRIVSFKYEDGSNVLKSDSSLWKLIVDTPLDSMTSMSIIPYNGHILWVGPQGEWWQHQDINQELKQKKSDWPPDPYVIYAKNEILSQTDTSIVLRGPKSKVTGLQIQKEIHIDAKGRLHYKATAENIRDSIVHWDLWLNTRLDGYAKCYIPVDQDGVLKITATDNDKVNSMKYGTEKGYFTFKTEEPDQNALLRVAKAFLVPTCDSIFSFTNKNLFLITFDRYDQDLTHPDQGMIEVYNVVKNNGETLLELEYHSPYYTFEPKSTYSVNEIWELLPYSGGNTESEHIEFLKHIREK